MLLMNNDVARLGQEITLHQQGSCVPQPACDIFNYDKQRCASLLHCQWQPGGMDDCLQGHLMYTYQVFFM